MKKISRLREPQVPKQPYHCKACIWGWWEDAAQFCSKPLGCIKADGGDSK